MSGAMRSPTIVLLISLGLTAVSTRVRYSGYSVLRAQVDTHQQAEVMQGIQRGAQFDFWTEVRVRRSVDVMAAPHNRDQLEAWMEEADIQWRVMVEDVQTLMEEELVRSVPENTSLSASMDWTSYHSLEDIYTWLHDLESKCDYCEIESIGKSHEGQDMLVMKVCKGGCGSKPAMWIDSGIHAREWIAPFTGTWMLNELVTNDAAHPELTEQLDWYFLPSHNPDGYRKSRDHDRMWRKTTKYSGDICAGTDANRNWDFHWDEGGASDSSCSQTYHGPKAFSEVEARNVRDFVLARKGQIKFYQTLHSYSQLILFPWGYTTSHAPGYEAMLSLANKANSALHSVHHKTYEAGCIPCVLYTASGTSLDWALGVAGVPYVYSIELRDTGHYGFLLPPSQIIPTSEEVWAFHKVAAEHIIQEFGEK